ncbi:MAG: Type 1 glutamine amidotransferase-like domain-containing protein [Dehalococcoidales bacterium]|nr:MAG: Type 1 glutamine amidotransferase-like domain-containing protein [Dehalococcoidales bacterium]
MGKIVALGGGEIGRPGYPVETTAIDEEIIRLSGKISPVLLFVPTATKDSELYIDTVHRHFGERLGCKIDTLCLVRDNLRYWEIRQKISNADIIYVGGGNTLRMMKLWRKIGLDKILLEAYEKGTVLSGLSAGAICWFRYGSSDSRKYKNPQASLIKVRGLNFINGLFCPHYNVEADRKPHLKALMRNNSGVAIAVDNCCAIEIIDDSYRILTSKEGSGAYKVYWNRGKFHEDPIDQKVEFLPLTSLASKSGEGL